MNAFMHPTYAGTSVRAIASEVGLSESVLYAHFDSKQAIFDAVLADLGPQSPVEVVEGLDPDLARTDPPRYLRELVGAYLEE